MESAQHPSLQQVLRSQAALTAVTDSFNKLYPQALAPRSPSLQMERGVEDWHQAMGPRGGSKAYA